VVPDIECRRCPLLHQCDYSYLFSGPRPPDAELMCKYGTIPVPPELRGCELSAAQMQAHGARIEQYSVRRLPLVPEPNP
jgi:hypothetical protein